MDELLQVIARQEAALVFDRFDEERAWALGSAIRAEAVATRWPIAIEVGLFHRRLFFSALPGSSPDNADWLRRKANVVQRYHRSSYAMGLEMARKGSSLAARYGLPLADYAEHGGAFPLTVRGAGVIGFAAVSGLPQRDDHMLVVRSIAAMLGIDRVAFELPA